jgi:hypothetical protein
LVISQKEGDIAYDIQVSGNHNIRGGNCKNIYKFITSHMQKYCILAVELNSKPFTQAIVTNAKTFFTA